MRLVLVVRVHVVEPREERAVAAFDDLRQHLDRERRELVARDVGIGLVVERDPGTIFHIAKPVLEARVPRPEVHVRVTADARDALARERACRRIVRREVSREERAGPRELRRVPPREDARDALRRERRGRVRVRVRDRARVERERRGAIGRS